MSAIYSSQVKGCQSINDEAKRYNFPQHYALLKLESKLQSNMNKFGQ